MHRIVKDRVVIALLSNRSNKDLFERKDTGYILDWKIHLHIHFTSFLVFTTFSRHVSGKYIHQGPYSALCFM